MPKYSIVQTAIVASFFLSTVVLAQPNPLTLNESCNERIDNVQVSKDCLKQLEMKIRFANRLTREAAEAAKHYASYAVIKYPWDALYATQMAVKLEPDNVEGWKQLGAIWTILGNKKEAIAAYEKANSMLTRNKAKP